MTTQQRTEIEAATKRAFRVMWELWPKKFCDASFERTKKMYLSRLYDLDPAVIVETAERMVTTKSFPPTPAEFSEVALRLHRERHPNDPTAMVTSSDPQTLALAATVRTKQERLDRIAKYILQHCTSGKLQELTEIWSLVWEMATTTEQRLAVHDGTVTKRQVNEAIKAYREGRRPGMRTPAVR